MTSAPARSDYVPGIDLLRFMCALSVALFHLCFVSWLPGRAFGAAPNGGAPPATLGELASVGWVGVPVFFIISGFVIAQTAKRGGAGRFLWARVTRLYPAVWACATLTFIAMTVTLPNDVAHQAALWLKSLTLLPVHPYIDPVYWTLAVEIIFYAYAFAAIWLFGARAVFPTAALLGLWSALTHFSPFVFDALALERAAQLVRAFANGLGGDFTLANQGAHFATGAALFTIYAKGATALRLAILLAAAVTGAALVLAEASWRGALPGYSSDTQTRGALIAYAAALALIAASAAWNGAITSALGKSGFEAVRFLGLLTYPLYLIHNYVGIAIMRPLMAGDAPPLFAMLTALTAVLLLSVVVRLFFERPVQKWLQPRGATLARWIDRSSASTRFGHSNLETAGRG